MVAKIRDEWVDHNGVYNSSITHLYGQKWPSDEILALWYMVPGDYLIEYNAGGFDVYDICAMKRARIKVEDALSLEHWAQVFADLQSQRVGDIMSPQSIDPTKRVKHG